MKRSFENLFKYHRWAYRQVTSCCKELPTAAYHADHGLFFKSAHATLNHLLQAERLWYIRITGKSISAELTAESLSPFWAGKGDWEAVTPDLASVTVELEGMCDKWDKLLAEYSDEDLASGELQYENTSGRKFAKPLSLIFQHIVNHGTHHRGQVTAVLSKEAVKFPVLDMPYFFDEEAQGDKK